MIPIYGSFAIIGPNTERTIKIGLNNDNEPIAYLKDGKMQGIFTDLFTEIARQNNWNIEIVNDSWPNLVNMLNTNKIDLIGGMAYDTSRTNLYTFSNESVFTNWGQILTNDKSIKGLLDLEGKKIAVTKNNVHYTGEHGIANLLENFHINVTYVEANSYLGVLNLLKNNTVSAGVVSRFIAMNNAAKFNLITTGIVFDPIDLRFAININSTENLSLLQTIDHDIKLMKKDSSSDYYSIIKKYIGEPNVQIDQNLYWTILIELLIIIIPLMLIIITIISRLQVNKKTLELKKTNYAYEMTNKDLEIAKNQIQMKNQAQYEFFANINHELRSPLHIISGYTNLLKERELGEEEKQYLNVISKASENLTRIVSDILSLTQLEKSDFSIQKHQFDLEKIIEFTLKPLHEIAEKKGLEFKEEIDNSLLISYNDDDLRFSQLLINIIENAIKYTKTGYVSLEMQKIKSTDLIMTLKIRVIDTGVGIDPQYIQKVFEPFFKIENSDYNIVKGVGLGLTIVRQLLKIFNGSISLSSEINQGTTVEIILDLEKYLNISNEPKQKQINQNANISEKHILLVDDINENMNLLESYLNNYNKRFILQKASGGREAIKLYDQNGYDVIFLDIKMPDINGIEVLKQIRQIEKNKKLKKAIIIATSAYIPDSEKDNYSQLGFDGFLHKPFSSESLNYVLDRIDS